MYIIENQIAVMDTKIEKKRSKLKIILLALAGVVILGLFLGYFFRQKKTFNVKAEDLQVEKVTRGKFEGDDVANIVIINSLLINLII
ncbi:hypothetical protein CMT89_08090 [Elizabethkingia anophelis]|nr:hypothetical protein [Elizabethkingia anophelis]MDV2466535.1 hypothetical protein [Elizabethkingia anophelis]MDV3529179.1 hypothetical protein [Elizabethkingia anophelis]MDV3822825.1 hypothetical protein [Elizabethkingia anophelis]MDV3901150.1 hypothetical protein [Elizabethkingia anophelis]